MPELPEVETVRRGLQPVLEGAILAKVEVRRPNLRFAFPERFAERLTGRRILGLRRRAKYLLADLDGDETLIAHLGMSGSFRIEKPGEAASLTAEFHHPRGGPGKHDHVLLETGAGVLIIYNDPRRFGFMTMTPTEGLESHEFFAELGPEPLGNAFDEAVLLTAARDRRTPLKALLLDQKTVAGLGNIYVCEALHRTGLSPERSASELKVGEAADLVRAIRDVLGEAILAGGSSISDHARPDGELGYFQHAFRVYDREGAPCPTAGCGGTIARIVQSGRSTFHCPRCQR